MPNKIAAFEWRKLEGVEPTRDAKGAAQRF